MAVFVAMHFAVEFNNANIYKMAPIPLLKKISMVVIGRVDEHDWIFRHICRDGLGVGGVVGSSGWWSGRDHTSKVNEEFITDCRRLEIFPAEVTKGVFEFVSGK